MEGKYGFNGVGFTIKGDEVPQSFRVESRIEHNDQQGGGSTAPPPVSLAAAPSTSEKKKKRGRPRKSAAAEGSMAALSPSPISASIPLTGEYSSSSKGSFSLKKKNKLEFGGSSGSMIYPFGGGLMPHMLTVHPGEDIMKKIISFSQQGYRAICILSANGFISNVTLRQPNSSGGTLTYEGRFEILSLTGSFMPNDNGVTKSRSGGMSVSLAGPDGRVVGGGLAGVLVAAGPVQVVIGSFVPGQEMDQKPKKHNYERTISFAAPAPNTTDIVSGEGFDSMHNSVAKPNLTSSAPFEDNVARMNSQHNSLKTPLPESISALPVQASREQSHEITC